MKKFAFASVILSAQAFAASGINPGSSLSTGPSSSHYSIFAAANNPAMAPLMVPEDEKWRINFLPSLSFDAEVGDVDNFADDLDELIDLIEDPSTNTDSVNETLDRFNDVLARMGEEGYLNNSVYLTVPIAPLYYVSESLDGTFFTNLNVSAKTSLQVIDDTLRFDEQNQSFTTNTSLYFKSGIEKQISFGFGREISAGKFSDQGKLYAGATLNLISLELSKQVIRLEDLDGQDVSDVIRDEYDSNLESSTGIGLDVGFVWDADWYRAGLTLANVNSPEFSYGTIGVNCENRPENTIERNNCEIARSFVDQGRIKASETHTKHALFRIDGVLKLTDRWLLSSSLDMAEYDDIVGFENQWWHLAMVHEPKGKLIPGSRLGYRQNLTGTELSAFTLGLTFFKAFSLDIEWGAEQVDIDGESAPRRFGFSLAFEESF